MKHKLFENLRRPGQDQVREAETSNCHEGPALSGRSVGGKNHGAGKQKPVLPALENIGPAEMKAIRSVAGEAGVDEILDFLHDQRPEWLPRFVKLLEKSRRQPERAARSLEFELAAERLDGLREITSLGDQGKAALLLPVPPHITECVLHFFDRDLIFSTETDLPPHLARSGYDNIDDLLPEQIKSRMAPIEALLLEGHVREGVLRIRRSALELLQILARDDLRLYIHPMPHIPHHADFARVVNKYVVTELF